MQFDKQHKLFLDMNNAIYNFPLPGNEPVLEYKKDSPERKQLEAEIQRQIENPIDIPLIIGGKEVRTSLTGQVRMPHNHSHVLANYYKATEKEVQMAIDASLDAHRIWSDLSWTVRASILLKAAELISGKYRSVMNAATMLGPKAKICTSRKLIRYAKR
jgi:1-pyrroline-5-carboxylate dehydrogenase